MRWVGVVARVVLVLLVLGALGGAAILGHYSGWSLPEAGRVVARLWGEYAAAIDTIYTFIDKAAKLIAPIGTLAGIVYGIYHKWQFSRARMHVHIQSFLGRDNPKLAGAKENLKELAISASASRPLTSPVFTPESLEPQLRSMRWGRRLEKADDNLDSELSKLKEQMNQWRNLRANYARNKASAHLLKGAVAASLAAKGENSDARTHDLEAFEEFKAAHRLDRRDPQALEYMAYQRVRLRDLAGAMVDFEKLETLAREFKLNPTTAEAGANLLVRALKSKALVSEQLGMERLKANAQLSPIHETNLDAAWDRLDHAIEALPESDRGSIDCAELYELRGRVHKTRRSTQRAMDDLTEAERLYHRVIADTQADADTLEDARLGLRRVEDMQREIRLGTAVLAEGANSGLNGSVQPPGADGLEVRPTAHAVEATTLSKIPAK